VKSISNMKFKKFRNRQLNSYQYPKVSYLYNSVIDIKNRKQIHNVLKTLKIVQSNLLQRHELSLLRNLMVTEFYDTRYLNKLINPQLVTFSNYSESKNFRRNFSANIQNHLLLRTNFTPSNRRRSNYYVTSYKSLPISQRNPKKFILLTQTFLTKYQN